MMLFVIVGIVCFFLGMILFNAGKNWQRRITEEEFIKSFSSVSKKMNEKCDKVASLTSSEIQDMVKDSFKMGYSTALLAMNDDFYTRTLNTRKQKR